MKRFKNILYIADSGAILNAFRYAVDLAQRNDARLTVIIVMERMPSYLIKMAPHIIRQARIKELKAASDSLVAWVAGRVKIEAKILEGSPFIEIIREVLRNEHDLVVKPVVGNSTIKEMLFGTTDLHLLRKCPCPVWMIKSTEPLPIRRILAAVDFTDHDPFDETVDDSLNRMILELAASLAHIEQSELHIVHAWNAPAEDVLRSIRTGLPKEEVEEYIEEVHQHHEDWLSHLIDKTKDLIPNDIFQSILVKMHMPKGRARVVIPALAEELDIDLIVMGTVARTGIPGFIIGNSAESILSQINCSVLAIKPPGFVTPVALEV